MTVVWIICWLVAVLIGTSIGNDRHRPVLGFVLSLLLGWIGVVVIWLINPKASGTTGPNAKTSTGQRESGPGTAAA